MLERMAAEPLFEKKGLLINKVYAAGLLPAVFPVIFFGHIKIHDISVQFLQYCALSSIPIPSFLSAVLYRTRAALQQLR